jgi:fructokinase
MKPLGGIEAGGTKFVCATGTGPDDVRAEARIPTTIPDETLARVIAFFREQATDAPLAALGLATFGPVDLDPRSPTFGFITSTPKPGWAHTDLAGSLGRALGLPVAVDTDVNGAALAEHRWGALRGCDPAVYVTVGTGVGGGAVVNGQTVHGAVHPEMGHLRVPHDRARDPFPGVCPYHGDCLEGLASATAMRGRWNVGPDNLPPDHPGWELEASYLGLGLASVVAVLSPQRIVLGGGLIRAPGLLPRVRERLVALIGGYLRSPALDDIERYVTAPALGERAGVLGAIALAQDAGVARVPRAGASPGSARHPAVG